jgi:esterase/lipase superfamily enzyme
MRHRSGWDRITTTGASFGGYHAANFAFRHPDHVARLICMGAAYDIHQFLHGYWDDDCYFNNPPDYVRGMSDSWYLDRYRSMGIVLATGEHDICLGANRQMSAILNEKGVPHLLDVWGNQTGHDWPWWQQMAVKFF